jgi:hypothetical protein
VANGRHRKTKIVQLEQEQGVIVGDANLENFITEYYKRLFVPHIQNSFSIDETLRYDIPQVSEEENQILTLHSVRRKLKSQSLIWNTTRHPVRMDFPLNFINSFGRL